MFISCNRDFQKATVRGKQFLLTGKVAEDVQLTPGCGIIAWGTVIEFEITKLVGMTYTKKVIGLIVTCPGDYKDNFFEKGKTYQAIFSNMNQADFGWLIPNKELLSKNDLPFDPYVVEIKKKP